MPQKILHLKKDKHDHPKPHHEDNTSNKELFPKNSVTITSILLSINSSLEETFVKHGQMSNLVIMAQISRRDSKYWSIAILIVPLLTPRDMYQKAFF